MIRLRTVSGVKVPSPAGTRCHQKRMASRSPGSYRAMPEYGARVVAFEGTEGQVLGWWQTTQLAEAALSRSMVK